MCGVAGFFDKKRALDGLRRRQLIERMIERIEHRGRDGRGFYADERVALGHVRLSILDTTERGAQPFYSDDLLQVLSYNGEIYNFREINNSLLRERQMHSACDTETLLCTWQIEGEEALKRFKGMFAFSLYDAKNATIVLAVDRFGIKPLYYVDTPDWFAWASEAKALLALPGVRAKPREDAFSEYFVFRQISGGATLFEGIKKLEPAELLRYDLGAQRFATRRFWDIRNETIRPSEKPQDELLGLLRGSVREHLVSDATVGAQLSGGVDSSLVTALASKEKKGLHTFSIGLADEGWNEFRFSRKVAESCGTTHHEILFSEEDFCDLLPELTYYNDEPISHSHSIPMFLLAKEARSFGKVLLSGEGADEVFFGYTRYVRLARLPKPTDEDILFINAFMRPRDARRILSRFESECATERRRALLVETRDIHWTQRVSHYEFLTYLPSLLLRQDKMGMAANLENRVPFLDHQLAAFGFFLTPRYKISTQDAKLLLKEIAGAMLPREGVYRPKVGFGLPIGEWLRNPHGLGRYLHLLREGRRAFLNHAAVEALIEEHLRGEDRTEQLWMLITLELWTRIFIDGENAKTLSGDSDSALACGNNLRGFH